MIQTVRQVISAVPRHVAWSLAGIAVATLAVVALSNHPSTDLVPTAIDDAYTVKHNTELEVPLPGVLANDLARNPNSREAILVTLPCHGIISFQLVNKGFTPGGSFTYVPDANFVGTDSFTYKVTDGVCESGVATVRITVTNKTPMGRDDTYTLEGEDILDIVAPGILLNDEDPDDEDLGVVLVRTPNNGMVGLDDDGAFRYIPDAGFSGKDSFTYKVTDGMAESNVVTVTIIVPPRSRPNPVD